MTPLAISPSARPLGKSGLMVSPLAWGMWRFAGNDVTAARARLEAALAIGITLYDTADIYGLDNGEQFGAAEELLGRVLADRKALRDRMVLATKGGIVPGVPYDSSRDYLVRACEASLRRMAIETIDLYQIHRPDLLAHPAEVAEALMKLLGQGKIRAVGVSNFTAAQLAALQAHLAVVLASTQPEFSPLVISPLSDGILDQALERDLAVLAWSPLAQGRLAGAGRNPRERAVMAVLDELAAREGAPRAAICYAWIMSHPARPIPIVGTQNPARIAEAAQAFKVKLDRADWYRVLVAARGEPLP
jgi:predicted oxidoreductase